MDSHDTHIPFPSTLLFPLPYRVLFLAGFGILGWAANLHGLERLNVDVVFAMDLKGDTYDRSPLPQHRGLPGQRNGASSFYAPVYQLWVKYTAVYLLSWFLFYVATNGGDAVLVDVYSYIPGVTALLFVVALICPWDVFQKRERDMFLHAIHRCVTPSKYRSVYFADVIFADIFTSFAKVLADFWLSLVMLSSEGTLLVIPASEGLSRWIAPIIMSLPYLTRLRQCLAEYRAPTNTTHRPMYNALKYATAFPVIFLSAAQKVVLSDIPKEDKFMRKAEHPLFKLWLLAVGVNSLYSFWWDVTNDWGLELLKPKRSESKLVPPRPLVLPLLHSRSSSTRSDSSAPDGPSKPVDVDPAGRLRSVLLYPLPVYPLCIFFNLVLRLTWSFELSSHLRSHLDGSVVIFWLEVAEVVRRWLWVFLRVEWELVRKDQGVALSAASIEEYDGEEFELTYQETGISPRQSIK